MKQLQLKQKVALVLATSTAAAGLLMVLAGCQSGTDPTPTKNSSYYSGDLKAKGKPPTAPGSSGSGGAAAN